MPKGDQLAARCKKLGAVLFELKRYNEAEAAFSQACMLQGEDVECHMARARAAREAGRTERAVEAYEVVLALDPRSIACKHDYAILALEEGRVGRAQQLIDSALADSPESAKLHEVRAQVMAALGHKRDAVTSLRETMRLDSDRTSAVLKLADLEPEDTLLNTARIRARLERRDISVADRRNLAFALGRLQERAGKFEDAFRAYRVGNDAQVEISARESGCYDPLIRKREIDYLIKVYQARDIVRLSAHGAQNERPIFVVGMPRSGTTLVEQILSCHPEVCALGERRELEATRRRFEQVAVDSRGRMLERVPEVLIKRMARSYLDRLPVENTSSRRMVDKNPHNFESLGVIKILLPRAIVVHCRRNALDTCVSNYFQIYSPRHNYNNRLGDIADYYNQYERLMTHWRQCELSGMVEIDYESLVNEPRKTIEFLLHGCRLEWVDECLRFHESGRPVVTPSQLQVRRPIYRSSVGRWRQYARFIRELYDGPNAVCC